MRNVNLAHGSLYLFGAYIGYEVTSRTGYWLLGVAAGFAVLALVGVVMQVFVFRRLEGDDLRQTLVTHRHLDRRRRPDAGRLDRRAPTSSPTPEWLDGAVTMPIVTAVRSNGAAVFITYPFYRAGRAGGGDRHRRRPLADAATAPASA